MRPFNLALTVLMLAAYPAGAQQFTGTYTAAADSATTVTLVLRQGTDSKVTGTLSAKGETFPIEGMLDSGSVVGAIRTGDTGFYFEAFLNDPQLELTLVEPDSLGKPSMQTARHLVFTRIATTVPADSAGPVPAAGSASGVRPRDPAPTGVAVETPATREWRAQLAGKKVSRASGGPAGAPEAGLSAGTETYLCSSGAFTQRDRYLNPGASAIGVTGRWRIVPDGESAGLELKFDTGLIKVHRLTRADGRLFADGQRVNVSSGIAVCR
jgi:hypothetical protein